MGDKEVLVVVSIKGGRATSEYVFSFILSLERERKNDFANVFTTSRKNICTKGIVVFITTLHSQIRFSEWRRENTSI